jgi:hypothetical protein
MPIHAVFVFSIDAEQMCVPFMPANCLDLTLRPGPQVINLCSQMAPVRIISGGNHEIVVARNIAYNSVLLLPWGFWYFAG